jgi:hypothetical protein
VNEGAKLDSSVQGCGALPGDGGLRAKGRPAEKRREIVTGNVTTEVVVEA